MNAYKNKTPEWHNGLKNHLLRAEIEYVAENGGGWVESLAPYSTDGETLMVFMEGLGFHYTYTEVVDVTWLEFSEGITVSLQTGSLAGGFCTKVR